MALLEPVQDLVEVMQSRKSYQHPLHEHTLKVISWDLG